MASKRLLLQKPAIVPPLHPRFIPVSLGNTVFEEAAESSSGYKIRVAYQRDENQIVHSTFHILPQWHTHADDNLEFTVDRLTSDIMVFGASDVYFSGPPDLGAQLRSIFSPGAGRHWVAEVLSKQSYGHFSFNVVAPQEIPEQHEDLFGVGGRLEGRVIAFDLGASNYKMGARNGDKIVFLGRFPWKPKETNDPEVLYQALRKGFLAAKEALPDYESVDGSASGVWVRNRLKIGNMARTVGIEKFNSVIDRLEREFGVAFTILNDGNISGLGGALFIKGARGALAETFGSDEGGGYANLDGKMDSRLWELAFPRVDRYLYAPTDDWSHMPGIGGLYHSQRAITYLIPQSGIKDTEIRDALRKVDYQGYSYKEGDEIKPDCALIATRYMAQNGDERANDIFRSIAIIWGYSLPERLRYCDASHVAIMGRVAEGIGGEIITAGAQEVLSSFDRYRHVHIVNTEASGYAQMLHPIVTSAAKQFEMPTADVFQVIAATTLSGAKK
ncbi:MAG TPA: hypothetical protein VJH97_05045 [Candidatus Nanoarchaeia archaeon]|nr:hypothetical protein [Candidatus Nanoarchaeia archaeon]